MTPVGLVAVSHSRALGEAAAALAREMLHGPAGEAVRIEVAAGLDETTFGTDAVAISEALTRADAGAGVVVLMDLGSAVLSAELALELLDDPSAVLLCPAPLVEGLVAAAVAAAGGADRAGVAAEALEGTAGKQEQLGGPAEELPGAPAGSGGGGTVAECAGSGEHARPGERPEGGTVAGGSGSGEHATFVVTPEHGLHARPAALLVQAVAGLDAVVELVDRTTGRGPVPAASLTRVASLGAARGDEIEVRAEGPQAAAAIAALLAVAEAGFGEGMVAAAPTAAPTPASALAAPGAPAPEALREGAAPGSPVAPPAPTGQPSRSGPDGATEHGPQGAVPGIAIGPAQVMRPSDLRIPDAPASDPAEERTRLDAALDDARRTVTASRAAVPGAEAAIFDAHLLMLDDPALAGDARTRIAAGTAAPAAWAAAVDAAEAELAALPGDYLRARAADVRAVGDEVLRALLTPVPPTAPQPPTPPPVAPPTAAPPPAGPPTDAPRVLLTPDLTPAQAATLDPATTAGVVLAGGSPTSHAAILLRARGISAVAGAGAAILDVADGTEVALDGATGAVEIAPSAEAKARYLRRRTEQENRERTAAARVTEPAVTSDGVRIAVGVNVGARPEAVPGADLAGLVRTEFLFLDRAAPPTVDEQVAAYRAIAAALDGRRIVLRTLDVGGDKPLPYVPMPAEANPFLGVRGLRLALRRPELLDAQLRAVVRTAQTTPVSVLFPMVTIPAELRAARAALDRVLADEGRPEDLQVGVMIEVPAAALTAAAFDVDFFSVGTNDLTQYTLAAERGSAQLGDLADPLHPAVLRLIDATCRAGRPVAVCGELAADPRATELLIGLGVRELSVVPPAVAAVKQAVREADSARGAALAARALVAPDAEAVRAQLADLR